MKKNEDRIFFGIKKGMEGQLNIVRSGRLEAWEKGLGGTNTGKP
jgi:hypothetical protein